MWQYTNPTLFFILKWLLTLVFLVITLSPFYFIRLERFKPLRWWEVVLVYLSSFFLFFLIIFGSDLFEVSQSLDRLLSLMISISGVMLFFLWPFSILYSTKKLFGKYSAKNVLGSVVIMILFFAVEFLLFALGVERALGKAFEYIYM